MLKFYFTLYENNTAKIKQGGILTEKFRITTGFCQGCGLSPTLFSIYLEKSYLFRI